MWQSLRFSHLILRFSLAFVFLWYGVATVFHPSFLSAGAISHITPDSAAYGVGIIELLVGISLAINIFIDIFAFVAAILIMCITGIYGLHEAVVGNLGLV